MYDVENNEGDVETAVNTLAAAASNGELYVITDEVGYGKFDQFCSLLANRVPDLHLWAAAVERVSKVTRLTEHRLTTPVRSPPAVMREVQRSVAINDVIVPRYSSSATPAPTDGPEVRKLRHYNPGDRYQRPMSGHTLDWPEKCERCGDNIADLLKELRVGQSDLQYRDTIIVCDHPRDNMPVVSSLRARGLPVHVVTSSQGEAVIRDVALGERDAVTVTHYHVVKGLERRVVVVMVTVVGVERLHAMSRSTSLLVLVH
nr:hypothetical protein BaRGS_001499 [Batillaria attramentaria]